MSRRPSRATRPLGGGLRRNRLAVQLTFELRGQVSDRFAQLHPGFDVPVVSREVQLDGEILQGCDRRESWGVAGGLGLERGQGRGHRDFEVVELDARTPVASNIDIALYDSFAQSEADLGDIDTLVRNPLASSVVVYTWNFDTRLIDAPSLVTRVDG